MHLDAGNPESYSGTGTTWVDLAGSKSFTLYNGVTYSTDNGGYFTFDATSGQYAETTSLAASITQWTVEAWHYYDGTHNNNGLGNSPCIVTEMYGGAPINFTLGNASDSFPNLQTGYFNNGWYIKPQGYTLTAGNWYHIAGSWDGTTIKLYVNGQVVSSDVPSTPPLAQSGGTGIRLMRRWDNPEYWGGRLAVVRIYDVAIGNAGVLQNFNAERARFGL
jgi:hypothetical protein